MKKWKRWLLGSGLFVAVSTSVLGGGSLAAAAYFMIVYILLLRLVSGFAAIVMSVLSLVVVFSSVSREL